MLWTKAFALVALSAPAASSPVPPASTTNAVIRGTSSGGATPSNVAGRGNADIGRDQRDGARPIGSPGPHLPGPAVESSQATAGRAQNMDVSCDDDDDVKLVFGTVSALHVTGTAALGGQEGEDMKPAHLLLACQSGKLGLMINRAPQQLGGQEGEDVRQPGASGRHRATGGPSVEDGGAGASYSEPEWTLTRQNWVDCPPYEPCAFLPWHREYFSAKRLHNNGAFLPLTCGASGWRLGVMKTKHDTAKPVSNDAHNLEHGPGLHDSLEHGPGVAAPPEGVANAVLTTAVADTTAWRLEHGPGCRASFESLVRLLKSSVDRVVHDLHEQQRG